ncbi:hypothetical protein FRC08_002546 [Ceratobasidium sp. 394]|nr:hypothetical protein FRC08_002546 [Ceratobasidium sp. 394]KAG9077760.1 hypothetical protein FS749_010314 [Ceratobasidium sp. UAMH 11750]
MLAAIRSAHPGLVLDPTPARADVSAPTSPTDATSPVPSLSRSILSASDCSPNGWVTLELPQTTSPAHSPTPSGGKEDQEECPAHVRFHDTCLIIPDTPIKSPGLAARMLGVGAWTAKRRVSDPDRDQNPTGALLGVRLPGLGRKPKHTPYEAHPCPPPALRSCLVHRSVSQHSADQASSGTSSPLAIARPRLSTAQSTPQNTSSLPTMLIRPPTRSKSLPPPSSTMTVPLRECCPDCIDACAQLDGAVKWSVGAKRKVKEDRAEREREAKAGLRDASSNSSFGWEDMLALEASETEDDARPSSSTVYQRRSASPPPSSLAMRRCGAAAAQALKHPHALPCPLPRTCIEDDTDEENLFPLPASPRGARSPCSRSGGKSPKGSDKGSSGTASPCVPSPGVVDMPNKCTDAPDPAKCAEVIAVKCAEKAKVEVVVPAVRRLLETQYAFEGHRLSPVPGSEEPTPRCGTPTTPLESAPERKAEKSALGLTKLETALVDELPSAPPVSGSEIKLGAGRRRSSSTGSVGKAIGAIVRGVAAGVSAGPAI